MKERLKKYWKSKSTLTKLGDLFFIIFVIAMLFPSGRMAIGGIVNRVKALISQPSIQNNGENLSLQDYNWQLLDIEGNIVNLKDSKGKVIFINQWATWCPPCVGEMPEIQKLYDKFKNNDKIEFYLITSDPVKKMKAFVTNKGYDFPVFHGKSETPIAFRARSIPTTYLITKSGEIAVKKTGAANWGGSKMVKIVENLLNE